MCIRDSLRGASSPHSTAGVYKVYNAFVGTRESETESESADFFTNPSETVRLLDFENRNNTTKWHRKFQSDRKTTDGHIHLRDSDLKSQVSVLDRNVSFTSLP